MGQQIRDTFRWSLFGIWIAVAVLCISLAPQLRADEHVAPDENGWVQTNGPYGGDILAIYAAPKGVLFVGTEGGGIFRSTDRGDTWTPVNTGLPFEPGVGFTGATTFAQKADTLYVGTRDTLYASTDGGNRWHHVWRFPKHESISDIVVIGDRIYVGTLNRGVWYSDDGDSWISANEGLGPTLVDELFKKEPRAIQDTIGLGPMLIRELVGVGTTVLAATEKTVFRKMDNEDSWTPINTDAISEPVNIASVNSVRIEAGLDPLPKRNFPSGIRVQTFAAMEHLLYMSLLNAGNAALFRSNDRGESWADITPVEMTRNIAALAVYGGTLYASSSSAVYRSEDHGDSWTTVNDGVHGTISTLLAVNEDTVFAGTSGGGVFRTTNGGHSWVEINTGITNAMVSELKVVGDKLYTNVGGQIVYTADRGESWHPVKIAANTTKYEFPALSVSDDKLYVGAVKYARRGQGEGVGGIFTVDAEHNTLVELITHSDLARLQCIEVVGTTFYIGALVNGISRWKKDSGPWITNLGLKGYYINMLLANGEHVYASVNSGEGKGDEMYRLQGEQWEPIQATGLNLIDGGMADLKWVGSTLYATLWNGGVFRSTNGGDSWTAINDGLDEPSAASIGTDGTEVYVGTFTGVFRWIAAKEQWKLVGSLPHQILSLAVLDGFLYAGTAYSGVFKIRIVE